MSSIESWGDSLPGCRPNVKSLVRAASATAVHFETPYFYLIGGGGYRWRMYRLLSATGICK